MDENALYISVIALSLVAVVTAYYKICLYDRSWINAFTLIVATVVATAYVFEVIRITEKGSAGYSRFALVFVYALIPANLWGMVLGYTRVKVVSIRAFSGGRPINARGVAYALQLMAWITFLPVLTALAPFITSPREIYVLVAIVKVPGQNALGTFFFISSMLARLGLICFLTVPSRSRLETWLYIALTLTNVVMHGSQGQILSAVCIILVMNVYCRHRRVGFGPFLCAGITGLLLVIGFMTYLQNPQFLRSQLLPDAKTLGKAFTTLQSYSDYVYDTGHLIDMNVPPQLGVVTFQDNFFGRIPRALWQGKPTVFGLLGVSADVRPSAYRAGYFPGFLFGEECADFGIFALVVVAIEGFFCGLLMKSFRNSLQESGSIFAATSFTYFFAGPLVNIGIGSMLLEQMIIGALLEALARTRIFSSRAIAISPVKQAP